MKNIYILSVYIFIIYANRKEKKKKTLHYYIVRSVDFFLILKPSYLWYEDTK